MPVYRHCVRDPRSDVKRPPWQPLFIAIFHVEENRWPQGVMDSIKYMMDWHHRPFATIACWKATKHAVAPGAQMVTHTHHCAIRWPQYVTSPNWPSRCLQTARIWTETTQKHADHQSGVQSLTGYWVWAAGMHGCCPAVAGDQVAVDLWNAPGRDVAATSQMGCPATAVVPRVSGSRKPPIGSHKRIAGAKPPASVPLTSHLR